MIKRHWREWRIQHTRAQTLWQLILLYAECLFLSDSLVNQAHEQRHSLRYWFPHINFDKPRLLDPIRALLQLFYLVFFKQQRTQKPVNHLRQLASRFQQQRQQKQRAVGRGIRYFGLRLGSKLRQRVDAVLPAGLINRLIDNSLLRLLLTIGAALVVALTITLPMDAGSQAIMLLLFWAVALWVRDTSGRLPLLIMIVLSITVSSRYLFWRVTQTINWDAPLDATFGLLLFSAELYAWLILVLGYIQTIWPLERKVASLPMDSNNWPSVDIYIPTYNEPLHVVRATVLAATNIEWPKEKLQIHVLDDGKREEFRDFCQQVEVNYIIRPDNSFAKAGNLNHALAQTNGDYVLILDCDHIPTRSFLQVSMGWFLADPKLALIQTPHHFFSPDPFERNLSVFRNKPNEGELFYGLIQDGNDLWNASFFCGSCAILKRQPLEEIGGIATETVTEDAHTALKLHRLGYNSAYLNIPQAAGLATESLANHIGQRMRWAQGMAQIFRIDNPLFGKGLNAGQRLCYLNAMLYFFNGIPRMVFMLAPLAFLLLHAYILFAPAMMIAMYALPHIIHSYLTNSRHQGRFRHSFWAEMYETVLAWYILKPTTVALFAPKHGKFNVTAKGGMNERTHYDWKISLPYLVLIGLSVIGAGFGVWRLLTGPADQQLTVILNMAWITYNLIILGGAIAVAEEAKQERVSHRVTVNRPVVINTLNEHSYAATLVDFSEQGAGVELPNNTELMVGQSVFLTMLTGSAQHAFKATVMSRRGGVLGLRFAEHDIDTARAFVGATFSRADAWVNWRDTSEIDRPISSFREVLSIGFRGYQRLTRQFVPIIAPVFSWFGSLWEKVASLLPRQPGQGEFYNEF